MEFANPKVGAYVFDREWLDDRLTVIEGFNELQWSLNEAMRLQQGQLVANVHRRAGDLADYARAAQSMVVLKDVGPDGRPIEFAEQEGGSLMAPPRAPYTLESEYIKLQRLHEKAKAALADFTRKSEQVPGVVTWGEVSGEAKAVITDYALRGVDTRPHALKGKPSRKGMVEAAKAAEPARARRQKLLEAQLDRPTAEAMVRGRLRAENPLHAALNNFKLAHDLRLPLVDLRWGPGRSEPLPEDVTAMFLFLAAEKIEDDLLEQLDRRYARFEEQGVLTLTEPERRRELAIVDEAIHAAEVEEAAHIIGLIQAEGTLILPPARIGAKAWLGIA